MLSTLYPFLPLGVHELQVMKELLFKIQKMWNYWLSNWYQPQETGTYQFLESSKKRKKRKSSIHSYIWFQKWPPLSQDNYIYCWYKSVSDKTLIKIIFHGMLSCLHKQELRDTDYNLTASANTIISQTCSRKALGTWGITCPT